MPAHDNNVRAVERALQILDCFSMGKSDFSLTELAREIGLSPSTTLRLISTLESRNYLHRDEENMCYYLGFKLAQISNVSFANLDFCRVARPYIKRLNEEFNESVGLYVIKGDRRVCIERIESTQSWRSVVHVGDRHTLTRGATGRLLLAYLPEERIVQILQQDPCITLEDLRRVREAGFALSRGEREPGIVSFAAPLRNAHSEVVAAMFLTAPAPRLDEEREQRITYSLVSSAKQASEQMGGI